MADKNTHLGAEHARSMTKITQSPLQLQGVSSRWLLNVLPWVDVDAGVYQVNRTIFNEDEKEVIQVATSCKHDDKPRKLPRTASLPEISSIPRHYDLNVIQTILELQSRAIDLYSEPHDIISTQIQLTIESLREKQEDEMINNADFGLLNAADADQRIKSTNGRFTPDALDDLLSRRRKTQFIFAHPKAIAAFGRECNQQGLNIENIPFGDNLVPSWRSVPLLSCNKLPVNQGKTSIIAMRTGEDCGGVVGLRPRVLPDQSEPGVNIRFMGINDQAMISYLVSNYFSVAVLLPNSLGILENIDVS